MITENHIRESKTIKEGRKRSAGTKTEKILEHLKSKGSINTWDAFTLYRATRLSAIIFNLRAQGYNILSDDRQKDGVNYTVYRFLG